MSVPEEIIEHVAEEISAELPAQEDRLDLVLRKILRIQLERLESEVPGIFDDTDIERVHRARVATRRMRSALRLFKDAVPARTEKNLSREIKWLGLTLGSVRDADVFLANSQGIKSISELSEEGKKIFLKSIAAERNKRLKKLKKVISSTRYDNLKQSTRTYCDYPLAVHPSSPLALKTLKEAALSLVEERYAAIMEQGAKAIKKRNLKQYHRLRILMKRLRYALEFISPAYECGRLDNAIEKTIEAQDCLGAMQDTVFTKDFIKLLSANMRGGVKHVPVAFALGEAYEAQNEIVESRMREFGKIWRSFSSRRVWKEISGCLKQGRVVKSSRG